MMTKFRVFALIAALVMAVSAVGCGDDETEAGAGGTGGDAAE